MPSLKFVYRGCAVDIQIGERATIWDISIEATPFDDAELAEPFGPWKLKLRKTEELDVIQAALIEEVQLALDNLLVAC